MRLPPPAHDPIAPPRVERLDGLAGAALTVDVEEWYHTCLVPGYTDPARRPPLAEELDGLLPELLELLSDCGARATFFVLGEVAQRLPKRVREIAEAGHEVASHGWFHLRANQLPPAAFAAELARSKELLEQLVGAAVHGFRAPEWSLRHAANPRLLLVAEAGFTYDSSLAPFLFAGRLANRRWPQRIRWPTTAARPERILFELPPLTFGGPLRLPAGSWPGRLVAPQRLIRAADRCAAGGGLPVAVVHPWEISGRPTPGRLSGLARFVHETGRRGYRERLCRQLAGRRWSPLAERLAAAAAEVAQEVASAGGAVASAVGGLSLSTVGQSAVSRPRLATAGRVDSGAPTPAVPPTFGRRKEES
jgi:peptidoglycan/xylan/chitin deacetylase (PgdA/CDA1 family)